MKEQLEKYIQPEAEIIPLQKEDVIVTSSCIIVSSTVYWEDGAGNQYSNTVRGN